MRSDIVANGNQAFLKLRFCVFTLFLSLTIVSYLFLDKRVALFKLSDEKSSRR